MSKHYFENVTAERMIEILGEEPTDKAKELFAACLDYINSVRSQHPEIPDSMILDDILEILHQAKQRHS